MAAVVALDRLQGLLRERGFHNTLPGLRATEEARASTGISTLDDLLNGGFARGQIAEISGPASSGCTAAALSVVAAATRRGEVAAYVDSTDSFHPDSAKQAGVELDRLLLVRCRWPRETWEAVNLIVGAGGFGVIVLDLMGIHSRRLLQEWQQRPWLKLKRAIENSPTTVVVAATHKGIAAHAAVARIEFSQKDVRWQGQDGVSLVLGGIRTEAELAYERRMSVGKRNPRQEQRCAIHFEAAGHLEAGDLEAAV